MSRVCTLVGEIDTTEAEEAFKTGDASLGDEVETFYTVPLHCYTVDIPALISEHRLGLLKAGRVAVTGAIMSVLGRKQLPKFYFSVCDIKECEPDKALENTVWYVGTITKVRPISQDCAGRDVMTLTISDMSPLGETSILYVCLRGTIARKWAGLQKGQKICGPGYLKPYRSVYEIYAQDLQIL